MNDTSPRGGAAQLRAAAGQHAGEKSSDKSASRRAPPVVPQLKPIPAPQPEPQKRSRGRPAVGKATKIRLSEQQETFAAVYGEGNLAEGVRRALDYTQRTIPGADASPAGPQFESVIINADLLDRVEKVGAGSVSKGIDALLSVADSLGREAFRRLAGDSDGPQRRKS